MSAASRRLQGVADDLGASRQEQLARNLAAVGLVEKLTSEIRERISLAMDVDGNFGARHG